MSFPELLLSGYRNFKSGKFAKERERYQNLSHGDQPAKIMIIACCDSRSAPETIFNSEPGEIFVVRNVANLVPPYQPDDCLHGTSAALEFAVQSLNVQHIVIMGHGQCGGISAALSRCKKPLSANDFLGSWLDLLRAPAYEVFERQNNRPELNQTALERLSILYSIAHLRTYPMINLAELNGKLSLHGAWFNIATGELWIMDPDKGVFSVYNNETGQPETASMRD